MKISLHVNNFFPAIGGSELVVKKLADYLSNYHEVFVFTRKIKRRDHKYFKNYKVIEYNPVLDSDVTTNFCVGLREVEAEVIVEDPGVSGIESKDLKGAQKTRYEAEHSPRTLAHVMDHATPQGLHVNRIEFQKLTLGTIIIG